MKKLYDQLIDNGEYTGSFETFKEQYGDAEKSKKLFDGITDAGDYTKTFEEFNTQFGFEAKTEAVAMETADVTAVDEAVDTDLKLEDGSLESQKVIANGGIVSMYDEYIDRNKDEPANYNVDNAAGQFIIDKVAGFAAGTAGLLGGAAEGVEMLADVGAQTAIDVYNYFSDDDYTAQERENVSGIIEQAFTLDDALNIAATETAKYKTIRDDKDGVGILGAFKEGNYLEAIDRTISGVFEAAPSVVAAFTPIGLGLIGASSTGQHYEEKSEMEPESRGLRMMAVSTVQGGIELASEVVTRGIFKGVGKMAALEGKALVKNVVGRLSTAMFFEGASEVGSQEANNVIDKIYSEGKIDKFYDKDGNFDTVNVLTRVFDTALISAALGGGIQGGVELSGQQRALQADRMMSPETQSQNKKLQKDITDLELTNKGVDNSQANGLIAAKKAQLRRKNNINLEIVDSFNKEEKVEYLNILEQQLDLEAQAKNGNLDTEQVELIKDLAKKNDSKLNKIYNAKAAELIEAKKANTLSFAESAESIGIKSTELSKDEYAARVTEGIDADKASVLNDDTLSPEQKSKAIESLDKVDASKGSGAFYQDGQFFINTDMLAEIDQLNVGAHETLHPILNTIIGNSDQQGDLIKKFKKNLSKEQLDFVDADMKQRGYTEAEYNTEYLTVFSDAIANKNITYNESLFTKIGDYLMPLFRAVGFKKLNFDSGKDVYNFMREYSKAAEKGGLSKDIKSFVLEKTKGKGVGAIPLTGKKQSSRSVVDLKQDLESLNDREFEFSEPAEFDSQVSNLNLKIKQAEKIEAKGESTSVKKTTTAKQAASSDKVQKLYDEKKKGYQAEIMKEFEPIISNIAGNPKLKNLPGYDKNELMDALKLDPQGLIDMINKYEKDVGAEKRAGEGKKVPLAGFINKYLRTRSISIFDKVLKKKFTETIDKASKVSAEDTSSTPVKDVKLVKATKILNPKQLARAKEIVVDAAIDSKNLSYKKLKGITSEITSEVTGIPAGKINNPAKNLSKGETTAAAMFISKNIDYIRNTLPEGAVSEGASENLIGTSTGVPKKLLDAFYVKSKRGDNLSPFVLRKGLTNNEILEEIGRPKDGKPVPIDPRSSRGSVIKGIIDIVDKNITNELVRTEKDLTQQQRVDTGAGRGRIVFSKNMGPKAATEAVVTNLGFEALNTKNPAKRKEAVSYMYNDFFPKMFETFGEETLSVLKATNIAPSGNVGGSLIKRSQLFINNIKRAAKGDKKQKNQKAETEALLESGEVGQLEDLLNLYEDWKKINNPKAKSENVKTSIRGQKGKDLEKNLASLKEHKAGYKEFLNLFKDLYDSDPSTIRGIQYLMYNQNANSHFYRNLAQLTGIEAGLKKGESREEHVYQAGVWAVRTLQAMTSKNPKVWEGWLDWSSKNYYQEAIKGKKGSLAEGEYIQSEKIIDGIYREDRLTGESLEELRSQSQEHPLLREALDEAFKTGDFSKVPEANIRKYNDYITLNPNVITREGITDAKRYDVEVPSKFDQNSNVISKQGEIIFKVIKDEMSLSEAKQAINEYLKIADSVTEAAKSNNDQAPKIIRYSKTISNKQSIDMLAKTDKALDNARKLDAPIKKIRVFDFDDTLARTKSKVGYTMPDGTTGKIDAETFAKDAGTMEAEGAIWDFSEFSKVIDGKKGPLLEVAKIIADKRGTDDVFVLTARPADAAGPIKEFLGSLGLDIPLKNITGLGDGSPQAKAGWIVGKAAEGYNDFYFADDATGNVKAVKEALSVLDVKSKVQQAKIKFSKTIDKEFNDILENKTGIASDKNIESVRARLMGQRKGKFNFFIPPSAEDFLGLLYSTLGKGKLGDTQLEWYKNHLINPFARAMESISRDRNALGRNFKALKKELKGVPKNLKKKTKDSEFNGEQAVRVFIWNQMGKDIPGLSKTDTQELLDIVKSDPQLELFAQEIIKLNKGREYASPKDGWVAGSITTDLLESLNTTGRKKYLEQWQQNVDVIFSEKNLNKIEAAYGKPYRTAMENILGRMKTGRNKSFGSDSLTGRITDWLTGSVGAIMFFNVKSAVLQLTSAVNFIDFKDNNIFAAGKAFANQPRYWKDVLKLLKSDFLIERRDGLKINVNEADIAAAAKEGGIKGLIGKLLKLGFTPTQAADSFAIATGGATFYRNRLKTLIKNGMDPVQAEEQAMQDFRETAEDSQQSSRPDKISSQQAGPIGRIILAFANTPAQYARLIKKAASDLKNGRGDAKTNISKILYYGVAQNLFFNYLQQAVFAMAFEDEEEESESKFKVVNGMIDGIARGTGVGGAIFTVIKNAAIRLNEQTKKKNPKYEDIALELLKISPPLSSKISKLRSAGKTASWNMGEIKEKGFSLDNPAYLAGGNVVSAATNIPLDRAVKIVNNLVDASNSEIETYKRIFLLMGWSDWSLNIDEKKVKKDKKESKPTRGVRRRGTSRRRTRTRREITSRR